MKPKTVRFRLIILIILGIVFSTAAWGWIQLRALEGILLDQQLKRLYDVALTVNTYYQHFPTDTGVTALDLTLKEQVQSDGRLARIDIFSVTPFSVDYVAGAGRISYDWPEKEVRSVGLSRKPKHLKLETEAGPALGLFYTSGWGERPGWTVVVCAMVFSRTAEDILLQARRLLIFNTSGLLLVLFLILSISYGHLIKRPLEAIVSAIDDFQAGSYTRRIPIKQDDEWGYLASHFNRMAEEIERILAENRGLTEQLSRRVQEATANVVELQKQVNRLQQLTAIGYLTATLAHDLGTPLHSIAGLAELLLERKERWPAEEARKLELIVQQTRRLIAIIKNLKEATRLPEPRFEYIPLSQLLQETLSLFEPQLKKTAIEVSLVIMEEIPPLFGDRDRLQTALFNLIQNSIEAMPEGGKIMVKAYGVPRRRMLALSVKDTGPGIPPELKERIWEPFVSTHEEKGLRGLGLSIVRDIVKIHGGEMELNSEQGKGCEIILYFPLAERQVISV